MSPETLMGQRGIREPKAGAALECLKDSELLRLFTIARREDAFAVLVQRHGPLVHSLCRQQLRDPHDAEDAFQATFLVLACQAHSIRKLDSLASWLFGVATRLTANMKRSAVRRRRHEQRSPNPPDSSPVADDVSWREMCQVTREELLKLPEKLRTPLLLCYWEGQTQDEAAHQLNIPRGTLKRRLETGRERLRGRLERRGLLLSALLVGLLLDQQAWAGAASELVPATVQAVVRAAPAAPVIGPLRSPQSAVAALRVLRTMTTLKVGLAFMSLAAATMIAGVVAGPLRLRAETEEPAAWPQPAVPTEQPAPLVQPGAPSAAGPIAAPPAGPTSAPSAVPPATEERHPPEITAPGDRPVKPIPFRKPPPQTIM